MDWLVLLDGAGVPRDQETSLSEVVAIPESTPDV
jgi:hypothetical protein